VLSSSPVKMSVAASKIQAAIASATQETTLALASFNFDFSLVKVQAPAEFEDVGAALTTRRRAGAENGPAHVLARRLGSLFESMIPPTPRLIRAYGLRTSEISNSYVVDTKASQFQGPFKDFMGIDGTTIWAAATSGASAVAVHLLACMLARVWSPSEAASIWEELVTERKKELARSESSESLNLKNVVAAALSISKKQLSEWDASARAWLRAADAVEITQKRQKQLMLIIENISLPVSHRLQVYSSVTQAWQTALITMDNIVGGGAYSIQDGAVLVALSAWHLYPDIVVLGRKNQEIKQGDELIPQGALLTIGLKGVSSGTSNGGVSWSLSLAHLRYYGAPVLSSKSVSSASRRLSVNQFLQVVLGCVIGSWGINIQKLSGAIKLIISIGKQVDMELETHDPSSHTSALKDTSWIKVLVDTAQYFDRSIGEERESCRKLLSLGFRNYKLFTSGPTDIFGLRSPRLFHLIAKQEDKVAFFRNIMSRRSLAQDSLIIRISGQSAPSAKGGETAGSSETAEVEWEFSQLATVVPLVTNQPSRSRYARWVAINKSPNDPSLPSDMPGSERTQDDYYLVNSKEITPEGSAEHFRWRNPPKFFKDPLERRVTANIVDNSEEHNIQRPKKSKKERKQSEKSSRHPHTTEGRTSNEKGSKRSHSIDGWKQNEKSRRHHFAEGHQLVKDSSAPDGKDSTSSYSIERSISFGFCAGDPTGVALFQRTDRLDSKLAMYYESEIKKLDVKKINEFLETGMVDSRLLFRHLVDNAKTSLGGSQMVASLRALASCVSIYQSLPGATISPSLVSAGIPLGQAKWAVSASKTRVNPEAKESESRYEKLLPLKLSRSETFACIAMLESGGFDLDPGQLLHVMAISTENSLYVAAPLLCDPSTNLQTHEVRRVVGNVGRAGIALLIPPHNPNVRQSRPEMWNVVTHAPFDGSLEDSFQSTSLHLSFSGYELPIMTSEHGGRFVEAFFLESIVSVHESGEWVADLDILKALESPDLKPVAQYPKCKPQPAGHKPFFEVIAIDCWEELLESPTNAGVVRAHGNWQARLAAAAISVQLRHSTVLFRGHGCWACGYKTLQGSREEEQLEERGSQGECSDSDSSSETDSDAEEVRPLVRRSLHNKTIFIL
jgi:hypothetical protein